MQIKIKTATFFILICFQLCLFYTTGFAQNVEDKNYYLIDSLDLKSLILKEQNIIENALTEYHKATNDSLKAEAIYTIVKKSKEENIWGKYNLWLIDFIKTKAYKNKNIESVVLTNQGNYFVIKGDYDKAIEYYLKAIRLKKELGDANKVAITYDTLGDVYKKNGDFINALANYKKSLEIRKLNGDRKEVGQKLNTIGYLHLNYGMHSKALSFFHKSLKVREEIGDKKGVAFCLNNIASVYKKQGRPDLALEYYHKSLKISEELNNKAGISVSLNNIGVVYKNERNFDNALKYYQKSLKIKEEINDEKGKSHVLNNIGTIYNGQGKLSMALAKYEESLKITTTLHDKKWVAITLFNIGDVYLKQGNFVKANRFAMRGLTLSKTIGQPELIRDAAEVLKEIYSKQSNWKSAFEMQELYVEMRDSIRNKKTEADAAEQRINYEVQKKEQEIKLLSAQNIALQREKQVQELKVNKNKIVSTMFLFSGVLGLFLALFFYLILKKSKTVNRLLKKQDEEKQVMLKEIHHRVKNNLQVVNSLLRLQSKEINDVEIVEKFKETQKRVITIAALHEKMYRSDDLRFVNLKDHIESIVEDLISTYIIDKKIEVNIDIENINIGLRTLVPLSLIINEIIVNSLKYAFNDVDEGIITLQIKKIGNKTFEMIIGDNGVGMNSCNSIPGFGSKLITIFTKQLNGTIEVLDVLDTKYKITFESIGQVPELT